MTVNNTMNYMEYQADGISDSFTIPFLLLDKSDLIIFLNNTLLMDGYSIENIGSPLCEVHFTIPPKGRLLLQRNIKLLRETDYQENGDLLANTLNRDFDRLYLALQCAQQDNFKALRVEDASGISSLSYAEERANKLLGFDTEGNPLLVNSNSGSALDLAKELADNSNQAKGSAMVGYNESLRYPIRTIGNAMQTLTNSIHKITISKLPPKVSEGIEGEIWLQLEDDE